LDESCVGGVLIRDAKRNEIDCIVEMGKKFLSFSTYSKFLGESQETMRILAQQLLWNESLLVSEREGKVIGILGYIVHKHFISGELTAGEVFWWVEPEFRGEGVKLMREMERRAKLAGAKHIQMIAPNDKVANFYVRDGFEFVEATYQRAL